MSSAVDNLADNLQNASVEDTHTQAQAEAISASAAEGRRLYIGNLAYATTEEQLKEFFSGYDVESTSIPVNPRTNPISNLSGKDILERKVSVQLARKPEDNEKKAEGGENKERGQGPRRGGRGGRGRAGRARGGRTGATTTEAALADTTNEPAKEATPADKTATPRAPKQRGPPEDGIASTTKVMVANLPYNLTEDQLKELFSAYEPLYAKIALRPIPRFMVKKLQARGEARKGRGFGFVTLASEEQQQKAVAEMNGKVIEEREIAVKVAIDSPGKEDGAEAAEGDAATNGTNGATETAAAA
ncbi:Single-stranded TG1-3 DNA-binding protein [Cyphellophora attinorum]|uniref:Single-stranded TG1-3 DNA-binding protein n=1 Tax=Cyphellophora attinorum TaxID=1664694 RepID=A0A0N0NPD2_9EURO|nr:Single-stranded TG1-3 DNA-binding protein [Phialophora attinorum]KPI42588.1 Single-stranded TG1-3 DNA-binding protein [Phialophora attinorum]